MKENNELDLPEITDLTSRLLMKDDMKRWKISEGGKSLFVQKK